MRTRDVAATKLVHLVVDIQARRPREGHDRGLLPHGCTVQRTAEPPSASTVSAAVDTSSGVCHRVEPSGSTCQHRRHRPSDVHSWIAEMAQVSGATVTIRAHAVLAGVLDMAVLDKRIGQNPARQGRHGLPKKMAGRHRYLSHRELLTLAYASGKRAPLVLTLGYCGLRWGEAIALRVKNLDVPNQRLYVEENVVEVASTMHRGTPKSHKVRAVPVPGFLMDMLVRETTGRAGDDLVFPGRDGGYMHRTRASAGSKSWFKTALREAGLEPMTLHELRHTAASLAVQSGANVKAIQRMLRHSSAAMTLDVYSDLFENDLDTLSKRLNEAALNSFFPSAFGVQAPDARPGIE